MKTYFFFKSGITIGLISLLLFTTCQTDELNDTSVTEESEVALRSNNSLIFPTTARPLGKSIEDWAIEFGKAVNSLNCGSVFEHQMLELNKKVVAPFGFIIDTATDEYTITKDQYVLLSPAFFLNDYPCPAEYEYEPAEGQSLEEFLKLGGKQVVDPIETIVITMDGTEIEGVNKYRLSTDLFYFTGNPDLAECYDICITGEPQAAIIDGYFMMLKKLEVGTHTVFVRGEIPSLEFSYEWTLILHVTE